jgi:ABC-type antimicrobial peptide transport system permease subunit
VYVPFMHANTGRGQMILYVRVDGDTRPVSARVREEVWKADRTVPQYEVRTLAEEVDATILQERLLATVATGFSALALLLTVIGLNGLLAFLVAQRTRELAIRLALGAQRTGVVGLFVREALVLTAAGSLVALPLGWVVSRAAAAWLADVLAEPSRADATLLTAAAFLLLALGALAAALPAKRAAEVDPMTTLRSE